MIIKSYELNKIDVNTNKIYNDDKYDYDSIGFPFLAEISREIINRLSD